MAELRDLYDINGNKTDKTYHKGDTIPSGYYPMVVMVVIRNSKGQFLMQKRVPSKGGDWGVTGGHPKAGETPLEGIVTEVKEELGLDFSNEIFVQYDSGCDGKDCYKMYFVNKDININDIRIQEEELTEVKWFSMDELKCMVKSNELNEDQIACFNKVCNYLEKLNAISFKPLKNEESQFAKIHKWCQNKFVYEWFEQRELSFDEICNKYRNKLLSNKQKLFLIRYNNKDIGLVQIYKFEKDIDLKELDKFKTIYEYDLFIGEENYLSKGLGVIIVNLINELIYSKYKADAIILRPFKRNNRAIKCYQKANFKKLSEYVGVDTLDNPEKLVVLLNSKNTNN